MKLPFLIIVFLSVLSLSCEKEANRKLLDAYFKYEVNGAKVSISPGIILNENLFECRITGDTALQILVGKVYDGAAIYISDKHGIKDGAYTLDENNRAFYMNPIDIKKYTTTGKYTGTVTLKKSTFQAKTLLNTLEGTFSYNVIDTVTGKTFAITNGSFLMERR